MSKPKLIHLLVSFEGLNYVIGSLSYNTQNEELSFHAAYPDGPKRQVLKRLRQPDGYVEPYHHFTWHKHGMHMKDGKGKIIYERWYQTGPFIQGTDLITPLYVLSAKLTTYKSCIPTENDFAYGNSSTKKIIFTVDPHGFFSMILFLAPKQLSTVDTLKCLWHDIKNEKGDILDRTYLLDLWDDIHPITRITAWSNYDLLLLCSSHCQHPIDKLPDGIKAYWIPNEIHAQEGLAQVHSV